MLIKRTKLSERVAQISPLSADSPPELSRSLPTSDTLSDAAAHRRSLSVESGFTLYEPDEVELHAPYHPFAPLDADLGKDVFVGAYPSPVRRASSSAASYRRSSGAVDFYDAGVKTEGSASPPEFFFDFNYAGGAAAPYPPVEDPDRRLLEHFVHDVLRLIFPILALHGSARQDAVLPALDNNECYRHCCLSIAALHLKTTRRLDGEWIDQDITRHRYATISGLCEALAKDADHLQILEATLGMILFQTVVGSPDDTLPDIPWHQHFQAATSLVNKLDLPRCLQPLASAYHITPSLNMTLTAWIDILGATMLGRAPQFADTYREKHLSNGQSGLRELMGCDDRVMYLVSEIACLEALKTQNMLSDMELCEHVKSLAHQIDLTEPAAEVITPPIIQSGHLDPRALTQMMTAAFRFAARIYLCSLVPGFDRNQPQVMELLNKLTACLEAIPTGADGFDRSLVWVFLIGGSVATAGCMFRQFFQARCAHLGDVAVFGSFGRMAKLLNGVWARQDAGQADVHWRDVMAKNGWEYLLV